ncbi:hypothetical protein [Rickettsia hoogstraalii]|uniref:hypothetical protein n=1 Tax=Rickettsia hoogstraalii TaxID=467174 RepID=UPI0005F83BF3|nr:hypothetical protein [Rickettsia hoogstraalii]
MSKKQGNVDQFFRHCERLKALLHGLKNLFYVIPAEAGIQKKYQYNKFLKLKAEVISLYAGFLLPQE